ncbi:hypothetical protein FPZ12_019810 [Amycolatopsis acidicola]|uniref:GNAT family N-acetyltransferase n=1 Tax=Amycolatopsis acidicola TaxID=2596893 RepID=A0A5N0V3M8_9PSEU|nr:hypothetical protein [Amycolatopsis acidicola]KAA9159617.1 hypothetical protein FPZ12_019810 [Amycolatopsis acidicola]
MAGILMRAAQAPAVAPSPAVTVRRVWGTDEYRQCERLQDLVWGTSDIVGIPLLELLTAQENGGIVLGAFDGGGELAGFVYSFPGISQGGALKQCSVLLCVHPLYRSHGIGRRLKLAQRRAALDAGIELITWTFDPLLAGNAALNVRRLGAIARDYRVNVYGTGSGLNAGLDTDRLLAEWWLRRSPWPEPRNTAPGSLSESPANRVIERNGLPCNRSVHLDRETPRVLVAVPGDLGAIKHADLGAARAWRAEIRAVFTEYFARGYVAVDFRRTGPHPAYVLQRRTAC